MPTVNPIIEIKHSKMFDVNEVTRDDLVKLLRTWGYSSGTAVHGLLLQIAELKGFEPITKLDLNPDVTYEWMISWHQTEDEANTNVASPFEYEQLEMIGSFQRNGKQMYCVMSWIGKRPNQDDVIKRLKQHGASV